MHFPVWQPSAPGHNEPSGTSVIGPHTPALHAPANLHGSAVGAHTVPSLIPAHSTVARSGRPPSPLELAINDIVSNMVTPDIRSMVPCPAAIVSVDLSSAVTRKDKLPLL